MGKYVILIINIILMCIISGLGSCISFGIYGFDMVRYFGFFAFITAVQLLIGKLFSGYVDRKLDVLIKDINTKEELIKHIQNISIECSYCGTINQTPILLNKDNTFSCVNCNQENAIKINVATTRTTKPLEENTLNTIFKKLDEIK